VDACVWVGKAQICQCSIVVWSRILQVLVLPQLFRLGSNVVYLSCRAQERFVSALRSKIGIKSRLNVCQVVLNLWLWSEVNWVPFLLECLHSIDLMSNLGPFWSLPHERVYLSWINFLTWFLKDNHRIVYLNKWTFCLVVGILYWPLNILNKFLLEFSMNLLSSINTYFIFLNS